MKRPSAVFCLVKKNCKNQDKDDEDYSNNLNKIYLGCVTSLNKITLADFSYTLNAACNPVLLYYLRVIQIKSSRRHIS